MASLGGVDMVAVFGDSRTEPGSADYRAGVRLGRLLAEAGFGVCTGGYAGLMEAVSRGAGEAGGAVIGVTVPAVFPERSGGNVYLTDEIRATTLLERIERMLDGTVAAVALPGSIGTVTELLIAWNLAYVARFSGAEEKSVLAVGERWQRVVERLADELSTDAGLVTCVPTVDAAVDAVVTRRRG